MSSPTLDYQTRPSGRTFARFGVVAFIVALAMVTYLNRACISTLAPQIQADLQLDKPQMSWVFSAFAISYALFEIPTAWWAQRRGTRRVLARIVAWWSIMTLVTAAALTPEILRHLAPSLGSSALWLMSFWFMLSVRFLFGLGEAGAWPCAAASYAHWIPAKERGFAQGMLFVGAHISGGLTPLLVTFLRDSLHWHWRVVFLVFSLVGFVWAWAWYTWFRDDPTDHPGVGESELQDILHHRPPALQHPGGLHYALRILSHRNIIPLCLMYIGNAYAYFFCITWLPTYIKEKHGMEGAALGIAAGLPLTMSVLGDIFGGLITDWLTKRFGPRIGRSALGAVAYTIAAISMFIAANAPTPWTAIFALSIAVTSVMFTLGAAWGSVIDIGGSQHTAMIGAIMNTAGNTAAIFSPIVAIYTKDHAADIFQWLHDHNLLSHNSLTFLNTHIAGWNAPLYVMFLLFSIGAIAWCFVNPRHRLYAEALERSL